MKTQTFEKQNETLQTSESVGEIASPTSSSKNAVMFETKILVDKVFGPQKNNKPSLFRNILVSFLQKLFHERLANTFAKKYQHIRGLEYIDKLLDFFGITYTVTSSELKNIPSTGRLIIIANHITGLQDPFSLVQLIANVIEPDHGKVLDPACGSGGMFVQSAHLLNECSKTRENC